MKDKNQALLDIVSSRANETDPENRVALRHSLIEDDQLRREVFDRLMEYGFIKWNKKLDLGCQQCAADRQSPKHMLAHFINDHFKPIENITKMVMLEKLERI